MAESSGGIIAVSAATLQPDRPGLKGERGGLVMRGNMISMGLWQEARSRPQVLVAILAEIL
jgi:hypothetical protein